MKENTVVYYPSYGDLSAVNCVNYSDLYAVTVNGRQVEVLRLKNNISLKGEYSAPASTVRNAHLAMFGIDPGGSADIVVRTLQSIDSVAVRPLSYGISPVINGESVSFALSGANKYLSVEINGWIEPLFIFADKPDDCAPSESGPGLEYFGPGVFELGFRHELFSGDELYLAAGSIVNGSIVASGSSIKIRGRGILCGTNWLRSDVDSDKSEDFRKGALTAFVDDLMVEGITMLGHPAFSTLVNGRDHIYSQVKIVCFGVNGDGINLKHNARAADCFIFSNDDELRVYAGANGVIADRIVCWKHEAGNIFVDDRNLSEIKNVELSNIDIIHNETSPKGIPDALFNGNLNIKYLEQPPYMSNIRFCNINIEQNNGMAIEFDMNNIFPWYTLRPEYEKPNIRDILFSSISVADGMIAVLRGADADHAIENVYFNNYSEGGRPVGSVDEINLVVNEHVRGIHFNRGMVALKSPDYNGLYETGDILTLSAGLYDFVLPVDRVSFYVDGKCVGGAASDPYCITWIAESGYHTILASANCGGETYSSSEMRMAVGVNLLKNPKFESEDMSMWETGERGASITRSSPDAIALPQAPLAPRRLCAVVTGRSGSLVAIRQDVTAALRAYGPGNYGLEASVSYRSGMGGTQAALKIMDSKGEHRFKSRGATVGWAFWKTCDARFQDISWTGDLAFAEFYVFTSDEAKAPFFSHPEILGDAYIENCKFMYIG